MDKKISELPLIDLNTIPVDGMVPVATGGQTYRFASGQLQQGQKYLHLPLMQFYLPYTPGTTQTFTLTIGLINGSSNPISSFPDLSLSLRNLYANPDGPDWQIWVPANGIGSIPWDNDTLLPTTVTSFGFTPLYGTFQIMIFSIMNGSHAINTLEVNPSDYANSWVSDRVIRIK